MRAGTQEKEKRPGLTLSVAGPRLEVRSDDPEQVTHVIDALGAACVRSRPELSVDWTLVIEPGTPSVPEKLQWPCLETRPAGPTLTITENHGGLLRTLGRYRPRSEPVGIEVNRRMRTTRLKLSSTCTDQTYWSAWLAKTFFATRLLAAGWLMLHASAVAVNRAALLFVAAPGGGKSTLAHRACRELGASFLADDLVLLGPDSTVLGWPTRVCLPYGLDNSDSPVRSGRVQTDVLGRRRSVMGLKEHRALGITHALPTPLGAVVHVRGGPALTATVWTPRSRVSAEKQAWDIPVQRLYTSDLLGLMGGPSTFGPGGHEEMFDRENGVELTVPDLADLPAAPVWEALRGPLPLLRGAAV